MNRYSLFLLQLLFSSNFLDANLMINIQEDRNNNDHPLKMFTFCLDCPDPEVEGIMAYGLLPKYNIYNNYGLPPERTKDVVEHSEYSDYDEVESMDISSSSSLSSITAEAVYCVPNLVNKGRVLNSHELVDRIAIVVRGDVGFIEKVLKVQSEGAVGVIIVDDGQCDSTLPRHTVDAASNHDVKKSSRFQSCGLLVGGFSHTDSNMMWKSVKIPVLLVTKDTGALLDSLMNIEISDIPRLGKQKISKLKSPNIRDEF